MQSLARTTLVPLGLVISMLLTTTAAYAAEVATLRTPGPDAEATEAPTDDAVEGQEAILAFASCMRDNGIDFPDPQFGVGGGFFGGQGDGDGPPFDFQAPEFQSAFQSCSSYLEALQPDLDPEQEAEQAEQQLAFARCMRDEGIDFPDPDPDGGFGFGGGPGGGADAPFDFQSEEFQAAFQTCQASAGFGFGPGGGGPGGPGGGAN